jgi:hypothetical protein
MAVPTTRDANRGMSYRRIWVGVAVAGIVVVPGFTLALAYFGDHNTSLSVATAVAIGVTIGVITTANERRYRARNRERDRIRREREAQDAALERSRPNT